MEVSSLPRAGDGLVPRSRRLSRLLSDERLVEQIRGGSEAAFEAVYDRHHRGLLAFCRHMLASQEEAEDAVQQTFISAYRDLTTSDKPIRLKAWLYTIARNRCLSLLRARREQPVDELELPTAGLSDAVLEREDLRRLLADVRALPEDQRAAIVLSEVGDLSHAEIAEIVGCETMKVKALVFQARSSLLESRRASEIPCNEIREQLATARGGALRAGPLRRHLRSCPGCSEFNEQVRSQRQMLALALPVIPSIGLKQSVLAAVGLGPGAAGGVAAGGALAGGGAAGSGVAASAGGAAGSGVAASAGGAGVGAGFGATGIGGTLSTLGAAGAAKLAVATVVAVGGGLVVNHAVSTSSHHAAPHSVSGGSKQHSGAGGQAGGAGAGATSQSHGGAAGANGAKGSAGAGKGQSTGGKSGGGQAKGKGNGKGHGGSSVQRGHEHGHNVSSGSSSSSTASDGSHHGGGSSNTGTSDTASSGTTDTTTSTTTSDTSSHGHSVPPQSHGGNAGGNGHHNSTPPPGKRLGG